MLLTVILRNGESDSGLLSQNGHTKAWGFKNPPEFRNHRGMSQHSSPVEQEQANRNYFPSQKWESSEEGKENKPVSLLKGERQKSNSVGISFQDNVVSILWDTETSSYLCPSLLAVFNNLFNLRLNNPLKWNFRCSIFRKRSDFIVILCVSFLKNKNAFLTLLDSDTGILKSLRHYKAKEEKIE